MKLLLTRLHSGIDRQNPWKFQLKPGIAGIAFLALLLTPICINAETFQKTATKYQDVTVRLEVRGNVVATPADSADSEEVNNANVMPMQVQANFAYEELVQDSSSGIRSVRFYNRADANIEINDEKEASMLAEANRYVLFNRVIRKNVVDRVAIASLQNRLTQKQWQLIDVPANSMIADQLVAGQKLTKGHRWEVDEKLLADFLLLDSIQESDVKLTVQSANPDSVQVALFGSLNGMADDAKCGIRVNGKIRVHPKTGRVSKVELTLRQKKDEGQISPGYDALIRVDVEMKPLSAPKRLTKKNIAKIRGQRSISSDLIIESPLKNIQFVHDRRWRSIINSTELMVLRLLDDGQVLGQCNVIPMPRLPSADAYTIDDFKKNVRDAVGDEGQIVDARARKSKSGNIIYEVEVSGEQAGVPLTWLYYHVAQSNGQRAMCIVTTESDLLDSVRGTETKMIDSMLIRSAEQASQARKAEAKTREIK